MRIKAKLRKHRLSDFLSLAWTALGLAALLVMTERVFAPEFAAVAETTAPLAWGSCAGYLALAWIMRRGRRLPSSNTFEVLLLASLSVSCLLLLCLASTRHFHSGSYLLACFGLQTCWFGAEAAVRRRFVASRFGLFPTTLSLAPEDFSEHDVFFLDVRAPLPADMDAVVIDTEKPPEGDWLACLARLRGLGIPVLPLAAFLESVWGRIPFELSGGLARADDFAFRPYPAVKTAVERILAGLAIVLVFPVLFAIAVLVRLTSPGPALFRQERVGLNGRPFVIYKFRTMTAAGEARAGDPGQLTPVGGFLRRFHLDELPQLFNVLKGDMAVVGPRPETSELTARYVQDIPGYALRHVMRPGMVSWALIHQGNVSGVEATRVKLSYDLFYLKHASFFLDFFIILKSAWIVARGIETLPAPSAAEPLGAGREARP